MRIQKILSHSLIACAFAGTMSVAVPAAATTLTNTGWLVGSGEGVQVHRGATAQNVLAGGFKGNFGDPPPGLLIEFWCYDLDHTFNLGATYGDYNAVGLSGPGATQLARLFQAGGSRASDADHSAGFQLALWNIEYDSDLTVNTGSFFVTGATAGAVSYANSLLADLINHDGSAPSLTGLYSASGHQNFITPNEVPRECCRQVPEPPVLPLLLTGLGAAALVETRRRMRVRGE